METVRCNFCQSEEYKSIVTQTDIVHNSTNTYFNIVECKICGLNFTNPRPSKDEIQKYYPRNYAFYKSESLLKDIIRKLISYFANSLFGYIFSFIPYVNTRLKLHLKYKIENPVKLNANTYFLDIGAGSGDTSYWWGKKGSVKYYSKISKNIFAVEPDKNAQVKLNENNLKVFSTIDDIPEDDIFDYIRMNWSLEHVHDPNKYFKFIKHHLKDKGSAIITVPNYSGLIYLLDKAHVELPLHLYHFKVKDIENFCGKYDLVIENYKTFSFASMYYSAAFINKNFKKFKDYSLIELKLFQKNLKELDKFGIGNDMIFELKNKK